MAYSAKAAIIGCGAISPAHLRGFQANNVQLVAACDLVEEKAQARAEEFGDSETAVCTDYRDILALAGLDFVAIATPPNLHAPMSIDALNAGHHVICEKPCVLDVGEADAVVEACRRNARRLVFLCARYRYGAVSLARQYVEDGDLGEIYRASVVYYRRRGRPGVDILEGLHWFHNRDEAGAGVMMDMGVYFMDTVLWLTGSPAITAVSSTEFTGFPTGLPANVPFDVEEHSTILARTAGDLTYTFDLAWISHHPGTLRITLLGTKGGIVLTDGPEKFAYYTEKGGPWKFVNTTTEWSEKSDAMTCIIRDFLLATKGADPGVGTTAGEAVRITELSLMAMRSAAEGREVRLGELRG